MAYADSLPLELIDTILGLLDVASLTRTLRTAKFLRYPSEKRLYCRVALPTNRASAQELARINGCFLETITHNERLGRHVVELMLGSRVLNGEEDDEKEGGGGKDQVDYAIIDQAMKKMINLKKLRIFGYSYIAHAHLDCVPFSLTHLVIMAEKNKKTDPDLPLLSILRTHPDLEELALGCSDLSPDLVTALRREQECPPTESQVILCPKLKQFDGYHQGFRLFLHPARRFLESATSIGRGGDCVILEMDKHLSIWLDPILKPSDQRLKVLEICSNEEEEEGLWFFPTIAPYLTSLTHLFIVDDVRAMAYHMCDSDMLDALGQIQTLQKITLFCRNPRAINSGEIEEVTKHVFDVLPDLPELFVGAEVEEGHMEMVYRCVVGEDGFRTIYVLRML